MHSTETLTFNTWNDTFDNFPMNEEFIEFDTNYIDNFSLGKDTIVVSGIFSNNDDLSFTSLLSSIKEGLLKIFELNPHSAKIRITTEIEVITLIIDFDANVFPKNPLSTAEEQAKFLCKIFTHE